ncbi:hypothetical protein ACP70R_020124 [Stipagrostis hirtigluma subsp. patula]
MEEEGGGRWQEEAAEMSAPLLEKTTNGGGGGNGGGVYFDGCPGCAVDRRKAENPGIPYGNFIYVWIVTLCTGMENVTRLLVLP